MKNLKPTPLVMIGVTTVSFVSCGKYEDGPNASLVSKDNRLCREWQVDEYNGQVYPYNMTWEFEKDGDLDVSYSYYGYTYGYTFDWEWNSDKTSIKFREPGDQWEELDILRLTSTELWFEYYGDEWHLSAN